VSWSYSVKQTRADDASHSAGLFTLFTSILLFTHVRLICRNLTTVESLGVSELRERERAGLSSMFSWWDCGAKIRTKRAWDEEWGRPSREGNLWWLDDTRKNWESVMGARKLGWIREFRFLLCASYMLTIGACVVPIGGPTTDGLNYGLNPRFDAEGRWRPKKEWPEELR
jgi:palmitoyltransferase